jgi:Type II secretion system (T2SS), protein G
MAKLTRILGDAKTTAPLIGLTLASVFALFLFFFGFHPGDTRIAIARMDVKSLETVVMTYKTRHDVFPHTLEELTVTNSFDNVPPLLTEDQITDPWGNHYIYDPTQLHPTFGTPLIWSKGPPGENKSIKNWESVKEQ